MEKETYMVENEVMKEREEDEANDTPVYVEADSNIAVVHIPNGSSNTNTEVSPTKTCPNIYKKGSCSPSYRATNCDKPYACDQKREEESTSLNLGI